MARKEVNRKAAQRHKAAIDVQRIARGRQARKKVLQINVQRKKMGLAPRRPMEGDPAGMNEWTAEEAEQYENEFEAESPRPAMSPEEAAIKIQALSRGKRGRQKAEKQVQPFNLHIAGFDFSHKGGQKSVGDAFVFSQFGFYQSPSTSKDVPEKERKHIARQRASVAELREQQLFFDADDEELATFSVIDGDKDGFISVEDLAEYLESINENPDIDSKDLIRELDLDKNGKVSEEEFITYMRAMRQQDKEEKRKKQMKKQIDSKTRRAYLIARLNGGVSNKHPLAEDILPVKKKKPIEPVQIGFD